jgi:hypothetical protein
MPTLMETSSPSYETGRATPDDGNARAARAGRARVVIAYYSQAGQTRRAAELLARSFDASARATARSCNLADDAGISGLYPMPWSFFGFLRAQPGSFRPREKFASQASIDPGDFDVLVLVYPVWFLSPASPVGAWLEQLPAGCLAGKRVITVCTSRNMWVEAQRIVRERIEQKGGIVVAHAALEDRAPEAKSLITTPYFFLTGNKRFASPKRRAAFPPFGIDETEYERLARFGHAVAAMQSHHRIASFEIKPRRVLAEIVGRRISQFYCGLWPLVRHLPRAVGDGYMGLVAVATIISMLVLMPPTALVARLPGLSRLLAAWPDKMLSRDKHSAVLSLS